MKNTASALVIAMLAGCATVPPPLPVTYTDCSRVSATAQAKCAADNQDAANRQAYNARIQAETTAANAESAKAVAATIFGVAAIALGVAAAVQPNYIYVPVRTCNFWRCW